jgi:XTP/dITP diphosphohydrolase
MRLSNKILLATLNRDKFDEFKSILSISPEIELVPAEQLIRNPDGLRLVENHQTYLENAIAKARLANMASHYPSLGDDSGLEVDALGGKPGVRSHRYAPPKARMSQDQANVELLLSELKSAKNRSAKFVCTLALVIEGVLLHSTGTLEGTLCESPRGTQGFGYDPIFIPKGHTKTLAEMSLTEKNAISHRTHALNQLMTQVKAHGIVFAKP